MKRFLKIVTVVMLLAWSLPARAQLLPQNFNNMLYYVNGCATFVSPLVNFPPSGAICYDTGTGGTYISNGTAFVIGGSELLQSNGGAGQITATTTFFSASGNTTNATTEAITMELPISPLPYTIRQVTCYDSVAPGAATSDAFVIRAGGPGPVAIGSMANTTMTCTIAGATAKSCSTALTLSAAEPAGTVIDIADTTTGTPAARTIACVVQIDEF